MNIFGNRKPPTVRRMSSPLTAETLSAIFDAVEQDPTAGMGSISKKDILIDKILAHVRITAPPAQREQTPLLSNPAEALLLTDDQAVTQ
jgi:hypothetical protein